MSSAFARTVHVHHPAKNLGHDFPSSVTIGLVVMDPTRPNLHSAPRPRSFCPMRYAHVNVRVPLSDAHEFAVEFIPVGTLGAYTYPDQLVVVPCFS